MSEYDYLIVGAGLFGAVCARELTDAGKSCLVIDQRKHIAGNCYTEKKSDILVHTYGAHIFHTSNERVWEYVNRYAEFNHYINQPVAMVDGIPYNLPFNMNLFSKVFNVTKPSEVAQIIADETCFSQDTTPTNLEEQAIKLVGETIYTKFIKGYTEKQWGKPCSELPPDIITRLPLRFTYDNNYFNDTYQGIPTKGYTDLIQKLLTGIRLELNTEFNEMDSTIAQTTIYTGRIDEFFSYQYGPLEYRTLQFVEVEKDTPNYQGNAVINYPSLDVPYTRSIEHKHFAGDTTSPTTIISYEFSKQYDHRTQDIPYYPIGNSENKKLYQKYKKLADKQQKVIFAGRLGQYQYFDMDDTIENALNLADKELRS